MKIIFTFLLLFLMQFSLNQLRSQTLDWEKHGLPLKPDKSILFGKDIIIQDKSYQNQRCEAICSAFNGWLYAVFSHSTNDTTLSWYIMKSTDNGITWSVFLDAWNTFLPVHPISFSIIACGNDIANLKVFVGIVNKDNNAERTDFGIEGFDGQNGNWLGWLASEGDDVTQYSNISLVSDYLYPAAGSSPYSLGILYTKSSLLTNYYHDSLIFISSSNGGASIDNRKVIAVAKNSSSKFGKVSISYGYSPSWSSGRYFAAWEEKDSGNTNIGHIITSHTEPNINSQFTIPIYLDSLDLSTINACRNPKISCQVNEHDNDSSNFSEVILFEKFATTLSNYDLVGCYNLQAASSNYFNRCNVAVTDNNEIQPDIAFNSYDNNFYVNYYDSTLQKLPMIKNDFNLTAPDLWDVVSNGFSDSNNLIDPNPKIAINPDQHECANLWIAERDNGNGVVMFDAQYSTYTGVPKISQTSGAVFVDVFPNPCDSYATIQFDLKQEGVVSIELYNAIGQNVKSLTNKSYLPGKHNVEADLTDIQPGIYWFSFNNSGLAKGGKKIIVR